MNTDEINRYKNENDNQINKIRIYVRKSAYLKDPKYPKTHKSVSGETTLSNKLVSFSSWAKENIQSYILSRLNNEVVNLNIIPVTEEEGKQKDAIENLTKSEIVVKIYELLNLLPLEGLSIEEQLFESTIKRKDKDAHIEFFHKLCEILESEDGVDNTEELNN